MILTILYSKMRNPKNTDSETSNSKFLKAHNLDKVIISKKFFEAMNDSESKIELSKETLGSFGEVI